jgi:hypothetical protein
MDRKRKSQPNAPRPQPAVAPEAKILPPELAPQPPAQESRLARLHRRYGWTALLIWLSFGTLLESLNGFRSSAYLLDPLRREFWTLAHFHGALLALLNLVYIRWAENPALNAERRRWASYALIAGSILMPLGFFLGGMFHYEGDPGLGIFLAPPAALAILLAVALQTIGAWRA